MRALILGGAACLWDDLRAFHELKIPVDTVIAVNDAGWSYPHRIDHWVTLHPEHFGVWEKRRSERGGNGDYVRWSNKDELAAAFDRRARAWGSGSSGLLAVAVAIDSLSSESVWLCGIPMDEQPHFFGGREWTGWKAHRETWERAVERMRGRVHSMSGWTRELLDTERAA